MRKLAITSGHNGAHTGAAKYLDEGAEAITLKKLILAGLDGVFYTDPDKLPLTEVIKAINAKIDREGLAVDIHFNAGGGTGAEACVSDTAEKGSVTYDFAADLAAACADALRIPNRRVKHERQTRHKTLGYCRQLKCHSVILEVCFVDSQADVAAYNRHRDELVTAVIGVLNKWR